MKKNSVKYIIDIALFVDICSITVIGFLLAYILPEGKRDYGSKYFLGLHRHDWGDIHLFLSILLLILLIFHLRFNWTWIAQTTKATFGGNWKNILWCFSGAWILVLLTGLIVKRMMF